MNIKSLIAAAFFSVLPVAAFAQYAGCSGHESLPAGSCMPGFAWDDTVKACLEVASG